MQALKCELCGSNNVIKQDGVFVCQHCGTKYTVDEAKKLLGTVKIDKTEENEKYLILARRAKEEDNAANAIKYYSLVAEENPQNWEAAFFVTYYQYMTNGEGVGAISVGNAAKTAIWLIKENCSQGESAHAVQEINEHMLRAMGEISLRYMNDMRREKYGEWTKEASSPYIAALEENFPEQKQVIEQAKAKAEECYQSDKWWEDRAVEEIRRNAERLIRESKRTKKELSGCYVATCVYGSYDCPQVWTLRRYRDYCLAKTWHGRAFVKLYYRVSPTLVKWFGKSKWFKQLFLPLLSRVVANLQGKGYASTPYQDQKW